MKRIALLALLAASPAFAADMLTEVNSEVIDAPGMTAEQILQRGGECLKSTAGVYADRVEVAKDGGTVYATLLTLYQKHPDSTPIDTSVRSRLTVLAKDGRFKITQTDITVYFSFINAWSQIKDKRAGLAKEQLALQAGKMVSCIKSESVAPAKADDW